MKLLFAVFILILSSVAVAAPADKNCDAIVARPRATGENYKNAVLELARGHILLEQMSVEGLATISAQKAAQRAFSQKRLQLIEEIGSEEVFEKLFAATLASLTGKASQEANEVRVQKRNRIKKEVGSIGVWAEFKELYKVKDKVQEIIQSPDRRFVAVQFVDRIEVLSGDRFKRIHNIPLDKEFGASIEFSPDSETLLLSHEYEVSAFSMQTGEEQVLFYDSYKPFTGKFSPDGKTVVVTSDERASLIQFVPGSTETPQKTNLHFFTGNNLLRSAVFSPDSQFLVTTDGDAVVVWNMQGQSLARMFKDYEYGALYSWAQFSSDGSKVISKTYTNPGYTLEAWDWKAYVKKPFFSFERFKNKPKPSLVSEAVDVVFETKFKPTDETLLRIRKELSFYNSETGAFTSLPLLETFIEFISFSPDYKYMLGIDHFSKVHVWDMQSKRLIDEFEAFGAKAAEFTSDPKKILIRFKEGNAALYTRQLQVEVE